MLTIDQILQAGIRLTQEQDDECYALMTPEDYYRIPDNLKPLDDTPPTAQPTITVLSRDAWCVFCVDGLQINYCKLCNLLKLPGFKDHPTPCTVMILDQFPDAPAAKLHCETLLASGAYVRPIGRATMRPDTILCVSDGRTYRNATSAADYYNLSSASVYKSIRTGELTRGLQFTKLK